MISNIIKTWNSKNLPEISNYKIISQLVTNYNGFVNSNLVNLYKLNNLKNNNSNNIWYLDTKTNLLYNVSIVINMDENLLSETYIKSILKRLKIDKCTQIIFNLETIKRNQICDQRNIINFISIPITSDHYSGYISKYNFAELKDISIEISKWFIKRINEYKLNI